MYTSSVAWAWSSSRIANENVSPCNLGASAASTRRWRLKPWARRDRGNTGAQGGGGRGRWRSGLTDTSRYRLTLAFRQALAAAARWRYPTRNPAIDAGRHPEPRIEELLPFTRNEIDALAVELGSRYGPLVVFAAETELRTNEWMALERRDIDRSATAVIVQRRYADGVLTRPTRKRSGRAAGCR